MKAWLAALLALVFLAGPALADLGGGSGGLAKPECQDGFVQWVHGSAGAYTVTLTTIVVPYHLPNPLDNDTTETFSSQALRDLFTIVTANGWHVRYTGPTAFYRVRVLTSNTVDDALEPIFIVIGTRTDDSILTGSDLITNTSRIVSSGGAASTIQHYIEWDITLTQNNYYAIAAFIATTNASVLTQVVGAKLEFKERKCLRGTP